MEKESKLKIVNTEKVETTLYDEVGIRTRRQVKSSTQTIIGVGLDETTIRDYLDIETNINFTLNDGKK